MLTLAHLKQARATYHEARRTCETELQRLEAQRQAVMQELLRQQGAIAALEALAQQAREQAQALYQEPESLQEASGVPQGLAVAENWDRAVTGA